MMGVIDRFLLLFKSKEDLICKNEELEAHLDDCKKYIDHLNNDSLSRNCIDLNSAILDDVIKWRVDVMNREIELEERIELHRFDLDFELHANDE